MKIKNMFFILGFKKTEMRRLLLCQLELTFSIFNFLDYCIRDTYLKAQLSHLLNGFFDENVKFIG